MSFNPVEGIGVMERAVELTNSGESFVMATVVWRQGPSSGHSGSRAIITSDGKLFGWIGGACAEPVLIREAKKVMESGKAQLIWLGQEADFMGMHVPDGVLTVPMACQSEGALQIYVEPVQSAPQVMIVGRSPMAVTLKQLIEVLNWRVQLVDFADFTTSMVSDTSVVIVATQGQRRDAQLTERVVLICINHAVLVGVLPDAKLAELGIAGIELKVAIAVKGNAQARKVAAGVFAKHVLLTAMQAAIGILVPHQYTVLRASPGGAVELPVLVHVHRHLAK
jgi:xanthine dehydrogenase accessory factor